MKKKCASGREGGVRFAEGGQAGAWVAVLAGDVGSLVLDITMKRSARVDLCELQWLVAESPMRKMVRTAVETKSTKIVRFLEARIGATMSDNHDGYWLT